jgi:hypothetical protein
MVYLQTGEKSSQSKKSHFFALRDEKNRRFVSFIEEEAN